jgi:epoxide hydrolase
MKLSESAIGPYNIDVPESVLNDLHRRLENTRWSQSPDLDWDGGMDANYLRQFCDYWRVRIQLAQRGTESQPTRALPNGDGRHRHSFRVRTR